MREAIRDAPSECFSPGPGSDFAFVAQSDLRPFCTNQADLDVDFTGKDEPTEVTWVLAICEQRLPTTERWLELWDLPISTRIQRLLTIYALTEGSQTIAMAERCRFPGCGSAFEFELSIPDLLAQASKAEDQLQLEIPMSSGLPLVFRRPTGRDQQLWRKMIFPDTQAAAVGVARSLLVDQGDADRLTPELLKPIGDAFFQFDPLAAFEVCARCSQCARENELPLSLEKICLRAFHIRQKTVLSEIDALASAYGWSEQQILAIPRRRLWRYLAAIERRSAP
jgi:hypothetical protein